MPIRQEARVQEADGSLRGQLEARDARRFPLHDRWKFWVEEVERCALQMCAVAIAALPGHHNEIAATRDKIIVLRGDAAGTISAVNSSCA